MKYMNIYNDFFADAPVKNIVETFLNENKIKSNNNITLNVNNIKNILKVHNRIAFVSKFVDDVKVSIKNICSEITDTLEFDLCIYNINTIDLSCYKNNIIILSNIDKLTNSEQEKVYSYINKSDNQENIKIILIYNHINIISNDFKIFNFNNN